MAQINLHNYLDRASFLYLYPRNNVSMVSKARQIELLILNTCWIPAFAGMTLNTFFKLYNNIRSTLEWHTQHLILFQIMSIFKNFSLHLGNTMMLIIGLGNPGKEYEHTRHNIGFIALENIAKQYDASFSIKKKIHCEIAESTNNGQKLIFIKPTTYMNLSGKSVIAVKTYYNIPLEKIFVIHDDIDLDNGRIKFKIGGGNGGHNGLKSIDGVVGNNYNRIRIGVSRPQNSQDVADYVLNNFSKSEYVLAERAIDKITDNFDLILENKLEEFKSKMV